MISQLDVRSVDRFRGVIARCLGLQFDSAKSGLLADVLQRRLAATEQPCDSYLDRLERRTFDREIGVLAQELTVPETYFFRNADQFRALAEVALPDCRRTQPATRRLSVLSAGCASGEEAYSIAIFVQNAVVADRPWDVSILGVDANPAMLEKARGARFQAWALREMPADAQRRWLRPDGRDFVVKDDVRASVKFEERNLIEDDARLWQPETYDVVFCRNVLMYFTPEHAQAVVARIARALRPGGYLFLGHAENLRGLSQEFHLCHTHDTFYYQRRGRLEVEPPVDGDTASPPSPTPRLADVVEGADTWADAIHRAAERIHALARAPTAIIAPATSGSDVGNALDLDGATVIRQATGRDLPFIIVLVEDEAGVRSFARVALQRFGYRVLEAASAEAAFALLENSAAPIHLLLTDLVLPDIDGRDLAVRATRVRPQVRILFMSGHAEQLVSLAGFLEPGVQLLEKPFSAHTLLTKIREVLGPDVEARDWPRRV